MDNRIERQLTRQKSQIGVSGGLLSKNFDQNFSKIREQCLVNKQLFEDPEFPANDESLSFSRRFDFECKWLRPKKIANDPQFFVEGFSRFDVQQGRLGNCWFLAAVSTLTQNKNLFHRVICDDNSFVDNYAGIFHFRFWSIGKWVEVVADDRLPTFNGKLIFLHSTERNEFWSALLEKAYAKLHGSYGALEGGTACEALVDFTGGVGERYELSEDLVELFHIIQKGFEKSSMMACSVDADTKGRESKTSEGLVRSHAYSILEAKLVDIVTANESETIKLLRLRNPWGNDVEWNGAWSDNSKEWISIPDMTKKEISLNFAHDGEFWISFQDFLKYFDCLEICNLSPDSLTDNDGDSKRWNMKVFEGAWASGVTAGGCRNNTETFHQNPQYILTIEDSFDKEMCTVVVGLMQKYRRSKRNTKVNFLEIGFLIYRLSEKDLLQKPLPREFFKYNASVARSPTFLNLREVSCRFELSPGQYLIVPSTFYPNEEGEFLIRVFTESKNKFEENDEKIAISSYDKTVIKDLTISKQSDIEKLFFSMADHNQEIGWMELKFILDKSMCDVDGFKEFPKDICRSMVAMLDLDFSGKLDLDQLKTLLYEINKWKTVFHFYDEDDSKTLSVSQLRAALLSAGYHLNNHILTSLAHRYGSKEKTLAFEEFVMCAIKLKTMIETFKKKDVRNENIASFSLEEWIIKVLYS